MAISSTQIKAEAIRQTAVASDPTVASGDGLFFSKLVGGVPEAFYKNGSGQVVQLTAGGELIGGAANFEKNFINGDAITITINKLVSVTTDGKAVLADSDVAEASRPIGFMKAATAAAATGKVILFGRNLPGVLSGLGFAPGDDIFMSETAGVLTNNPGDFTGSDDNIIRIGVATCADGATAALATDLIMMREVIANV